MPVSATIAARASRTTGGFKSGVQWPPRAGYYTPAKMPLNVIFPRPDGETQAHARQKWAHTDFPMQIPIGVQGGAWPFRYEIIYDPSGAATIGQYLGDAKYGVVEFDNDLLESGETYEYTVRVHGADLVYTDINRSFTVDNTKFVFMQKGYAGTQVGTIDQPLEDIEDWYLNSDTDATYHNKILVCRGGNYTATGNSAFNPANIVLNQDYKTPSIIGFPEEVPVWSMTNAKIYDNSGIDDVYIQGITFDGFREVANAHHIWLAAVSNRITLHRCTFKNIEAGSVGDDNTNPVFLSGTNPAKNYVYQADCIYENVNSSDGAGNGGLIDIYTTSNICIERNLARNCNTYGGFWLKGTIAFVSLRGNTAVENMTGRCFEIGYGAEVGTGVDPHDHEVCWNNFRSSTGVCMFANSNSRAATHYNTWIYRNALQGTDGVCRNATADNKFKLDSNFLNLSSYENWNESMQESTVPDIKSTAIDANGNLTGALGFGTHGWGAY